MLIHPKFVGGDRGMNYFLSYFFQQMYPYFLQYMNTSCRVNEGCLSQVHDWFGEALIEESRRGRDSYHVLFRY